MNKYFTTKNYIILSLLTSGLCFAFSMFEEHIAGLKPCILCIYQRYEHLAIAIFSLIFIFIKKDKLSSILLIILFFISALTASYHSLIEWKVIEPVMNCNLNIDFDNVQNLDYHDCSKPDWLLFGLTMANYNLLLSTFMYILGIIVLKIKR